MAWVGRIAVVALPVKPSKQFLQISHGEGELRAPGNGSEVKVKAGGSAEQCDGDMTASLTKINVRLAWDQPLEVRETT